VFALIAHNIDKKKMKTLSLLGLIAVAGAMPQLRRDDNSGEEIERRAHPSLITNCIAENHKDGIEKIRGCLDCFEESGDPLSQEGLPKALECTKNFLPRVNADCAEPIAAMEPDNEELAVNALQCFAAVTQIMASEECLANGSSDNMVETLTDGVICLKDMHRNVSFQVNKLFEKEIKKDFEDFKKFIENKPKPKMPRRDPMADQMATLISKRHCEIASSNEAEEIACLQCFEQTKPTVGVELPSKSDYVKSLASCSAKHLSPKYDQCTSMMKEMSEDPETKSKTMGKDIFLCYMRVVTKNLVEQCSNGMTETTPENLLTVMECGSYNVFDWIRKNVKPPTFEDYPVDIESEDYNEVI